MKREGFSKSESNELLQLVSFELNREEFGIDILMVHEIIRMIQITKVPNSPDFIEGVVNLRGRVIPVVNLRSKLGMPELNKKMIVPFNQLRNEESFKAGLGFGLAIVKSIIELYYVFLNIEIQEGVRTTIEFGIPLSNKHGESK
ncbi:MAG: chemotaxis protein CheW [Ignavibacteriales bacterium]|nr:chemotaxis protein CheW [Ignavibacteriales bacterium]